MQRNIDWKSEKTECDVLLGDWCYYIYEHYLEQCHPTHDNHLSLLTLSLSSSFIRLSLFLFPSYFHVLVYSIFVFPSFLHCFWCGCRITLCDKNSIVLPINDVTFANNIFGWMDEWMKVGTIYLPIIFNHMKFINTKSRS